MPERQVTVEGNNSHRQIFLRASRPEPDRVRGTFPLPEAQLDRFLTRVELGYPSQGTRSTT